MGWMYLAVVAGGVVLAWRNLRLRRSDRRGAFRVAFYFFCIGLLISAIQAHHTAGPAEGGVFEMGLAQAAARAILFWLWVTALEPLRAAIMAADTHLLEPAAGRAMA